MKTLLLVLSLTIFNKYYIIKKKEKVDNKIYKYKAVSNEGDTATIYSSINWNKKDTIYYKEIFK